MSLKNSFFRRLSMLLLIASFSALMINACSDSATDPVVKETGNLNDSTFAAASDILSDAAFELEALNWFDAMFDSIPGAAVSPRRFAGETHNKRAVVESLIDYNLVIDEVNWWFIFTVTIARGNDTANLVDSVRFLAGGVAVNPAVNSDYTVLETRVHAQINGNTDGVFVGTVASHAVALLEEIGTDSIAGDTLGASYFGADTLIGSSWDSSASCDITVTSSTSATNLVFVEYPNGGESCPLSGSISASATLDLLCLATGGTDTLDVAGAWSVSATFNGDGSADMVFEDATTRWTTTMPCDQQPAAGPVGNIRFPGN